MTKLLKNTRFSQLSLLMIFSCVGNLSFSQSVYNSANYMQVDDSLLYSRQTSGLNGFNFDTTGANITWDYSNLVFNAQSTSTYFDPDLSGYKAGWCLSNGYGFTCNTNFQALTNLATSDLDSITIGNISIENQVLHQKMEVNTLENRMVGITTVVQNVPVKFSFEYEDYDTLYQFPLQYNDIDSSSSRLVMDLFPLPIAQSRNSNRLNTVEGWGTLITPYGTYNNVLKMKTVIERKDTLTINTISLPTLMTEVEYKWWDTSFGLPVMEAKGSIVGQNSIITSVSYLDTIQCVEPTALFVYTPVLPQIDTLTQQAQVDFTNLSQSYDSLHWDFGDNSTSSDINPSHNYNAAGTYFVTLIACNSVCGPGSCDTLTVPLVVLDSNSVSAGFTFFPVWPCQGDTVNFANTSLNDTIGYWDFGDGDTAIAASPSHYYSAPGTYSVTLIAANGVDADTIVQDITITSVPLIVDAGLDTIICPGDTILLNPSAGSASFYNWSSTDSTMSCSFCENPQVSPSNGTEYIVNVTDVCGTGSDTLFVAVDTAIVLADFTFGNSLYDVSFSDASVNSLSWEWDFGDGNTSTSQNPQHTYLADGTYIVCLTANGLCSSNTYCDTVSLNFASLNEVFESSFKVYPNPSNGNLNLMFSGEKDRLIIVANQTGKIITQFNSNSQKVQLDIENSAAGIYTLIVVSDEGIQRKQVVIE